MCRDCCGASDAEDRHDFKSSYLSFCALGRSTGVWVGICVPFPAVIAVEFLQLELLFPGFAEVGGCCFGLAAL